MTTVATDAAPAMLRAARKLVKETQELDFSSAVPWVYNPLQYAWDMHRAFLTRYARSSCRVLFLGMNPGPWGMAQTGVPFGEIAAVREFLQLDAPVSKPNPEHPKRPIEGMNCPRSEVSGRRLWGLFAERFNSADAFFDEHFVTNFCPLVFMEESARNVTPDKLPAAIRSELESVCDRHLASVLKCLQPDWLIGVGAFAEACGRRVQEKVKVPFKIGRILHPSPASPAANKDWSGTASKQLAELGIWT